MVSTDSTGFSTYSRKWEVESEKADYTNWNRTQETEELNNFHSFFNILTKRSGFDKIFLWIS